MASKRNSGKEDSTSSTSTSTKGEHSGASSVINTFANDGSFLELFKKRMEKESQKGQATEKSVGEDDVKRKVDASCEEKQTEKTAPGSTKILTQQVWFIEKKRRLLFFPFVGRDRALVT